MSYYYYEYNKVMNEYVFFLSHSLAPRCERDEQEVEEEDEKCLVMSWRLTPLALLARLCLHICLVWLLPLTKWACEHDDEKRKIYMSNALLMTHHICDDAPLNMIIPQ